MNTLCAIVTHVLLMRLWVIVTYIMTVILEFFLLSRKFKTYSRRLNAQYYFHIFPLSFLFNKSQLKTFE